MKKLTKYFTLTELVIVIGIIAVIAIIFVPGILAAKRNSNEKECIGLLGLLHSDQKTYKADNNIYAKIWELKDTGRQGQHPTSPTTIIAGYLFTDLIAAPTKDNYAVLATPVSPGSTGEKIFAITNMGTVRTDTDVKKGFMTSKAAGISAIAASKLKDVIPAGSEQNGVDNINNNFLEAK